MARNGDFKARTITAVAKRTGGVCSNPNCRAPTFGPNAAPDEFTNVGVAAHISAASEGGPRYDATLTARQRSSAENALWSCQTCAKRIDDDVVAYPTVLLHGWKFQAELAARQRLGRPAVANVPDARTARLSAALARAEANYRAVKRQGGDIHRVRDELDALKRELRQSGQLTPGDSLDHGRYLLIRKIGAGAFATVWAADDTVDGRQVAVKLLHPHLAADPERLRHFERGARAMARISNPNVVRVLSGYRSDLGYHYFVMEYVAGGTLRNAASASPYTVTNLPKLTDALFSGIGAAHQAGIIHRDLKPENVLVTPEGDIRVTDFDLASTDDTIAATKTAGLGTVIYSAPELFGGSAEVDKRADVYGIGMLIVFALLGNDPPYSTAHAGRPVLESLFLPEWFQEVLQQAIAWERRERFTSLEAFRSSLRSLYDRPIGPATLVADAPATALLSPLIEAPQHLESNPPGLPSGVAYRRYMNVRFAFAIDVPLFLNEDAPPANADGRTFRLGTALEFRVWGMHPAPEIMTLRDSFDLTLATNKDHGVRSDGVFEGNSYRIVRTDNPLKELSYTRLDSSVILAAAFQYPARYESYFQPIFNRMISSLTRVFSGHLPPPEDTPTEPSIQ